MFRMCAPARSDAIADRWPLHPVCTQAKRAIDRPLQAAGRSVQDRLSLRLGRPPSLPGAAHGTCPGCRAGWPLRPVWARQNEQSDCQAAQPGAGGQPWPPVRRRSWKAPQTMRPGRTGPCAFGWLETESMPRRRSHHQFKRYVTPATSAVRRRHEPGTAPPHTGINWPWSAQRPHAPAGARCPGRE